MQMIDREILKSSALVIDSNPTSRGMLASQLRDFGVGTVVQSTRIHDARRQLEARTFDIVLCEQEFEAEGYSGQNLLDDLRRMQVLPMKTVFIIVTGDATYATVADAAESAVDSYLLKPYTGVALGERITQARKRKKSLGEIFTAIEAGDLAKAGQLCQKRFTERGPYHLYAARLGCELLLRSGDPEAARRLNEAVLELDATTAWARLGVARAQAEAQQPGKAQRTLEALVEDQPAYLDALDVLGRLRVDQGDLAGALEAYRVASSRTPGSIGRLQRHGLLAFYTGDHDEAQKPLERAALLGLGSRMLDPQVLLLVLAMRFAQRDSKGLQRALDTLVGVTEKEPDSVRLKRLEAVARVFDAVHYQQQAVAEAGLATFAESLRDADLDIEAACNLLTLWSLLHATRFAVDGIDDWVDTLALRFAASRGTLELLVGAASAWPAMGARIQQAQQSLTEIAEQSVALVLAGNPRDAVGALLHHGARTLNAKLIDLARLTLQRHRDKIGDADMLETELARVRRLIPSGAALPPLGQTGDRQAGGMNVRVAAPATVGATAARPA